MSTVTLHEGDMLEVLPQLKAAGVTVHTVVTDAPYHLTSIVKRYGSASAAATKAGTKEHHTGAFARGARGFMGKQWDGGDIAFRPETWQLCFDLLPPGGHLVAFSGARTYHRMACAIEDAGFEIRDALLDLVASDAAVQLFLASLNAEQRAAFARCLTESPFGGMLAWLYGSGFPKSHDTAVAFDKALLGFDERDDAKDWEMSRSHFAAMFEGWGTALKPAFEPICFARKPLEGTVAENMAKYGVGALNIDACRVATGDDLNGGAYSGGERQRAEYSSTDSKEGAVPLSRLNRGIGQFEQPQGRWPANVVHDGSGEVVSAFPGAPGQLARASASASARKDQLVYGAMARGSGGREPRGDVGSAARFFYSSKADAGDRLGSKHPTVKPVDLMRWLVRLVTPPGGTVLDPFAGSGTTGMACLAEGFNAVLVERESEYAADIRRRIAHVRGEDAPLFAGAAE